jgi:NADH-quinone oxidoreductase subunit M
MDSHILSIVLFTPLAGMIPLLFFPKKNKTLIKVWANVVMVIGLLISLPLWWRLDRSNAGFQFVERVSWIPSIGASYHIGVDGISMLMVILTASIGLIAVFSSWSVIEDRVKEYYCFFLLLQSGILGVFMALDFLLFYVFWEVMLVPMYFIIGVWGGPRKLYAAIKFFLYTLFGSVLMLLGILALYFHHHNQFGIYTFDIVALMNTTVPLDIQKWVFWAFFLGFAIKVPMFPFHTWLPDAHVEAPTAGSVILAGVLLKMGTYGFIRFSLPMLPDASAIFAPVILWLSVFAILYGGYLALAQTDLKRMVAYSSISHMGFVTLGIFGFSSQGIQGAVLQMFNHGITTGALFLAVGQLYDRTHSRSISDYGGLHGLMPRFAAFLCLFSVASFGLPGTANFIGEFLVLVGTSYRSFVLVLLAMGGIVLTAAYMLWMLQRVMLGPAPKKALNRLNDLSLRETLILAPLALVIFWFGLYPRPLIESMDVSVTALVQKMRNAAQGEIVAAPVAPEESPRPRGVNKVLP